MWLQEWLLGVASGLGQENLNCIPATLSIGFRIGHGRTPFLQLRWIIATRKHSSAAAKRRKKKNPLAVGLPDFSYCQSHTLGPVVDSELAGNDKSKVGSTWAPAPRVFPQVFSHVGEYLRFLELTQFNNILQWSYMVMVCHGQASTRVIQLA